MTHGLNWRQLLDCAGSLPGETQRRLERSGDSTFVGTTQAAAQSKAAWRSTSRRTPKREI
jgi:hypothetical protein